MRLFCNLTFQNDLNGGEIKVEQGNFNWKWV
jgi:hypothetical protein